MTFFTADLYQSTYPGPGTAWCWRESRESHGRCSLPTQGYIIVINDDLVTPLDQNLLEGEEPALEAFSAQQACSLCGVQGKGT